MKTLTLAEPWSYRTALVTIDYPAGDHEVADDIHAAAISAGVTEGTSDGGGNPEDGSQGSADQAEG